MATNRLPDQLDRLFALAEDEIDGLTAIGAATGVAQNTAPVIQAVLNAARGAEAAYQGARVIRTTATTAQTVADSNARAFIGSAKRVLQTYLGTQWNTAWAQAGFVNGSLATPNTLAERLSALGSLRDYFTSNPGHENAPLNVTAAIAGARHTAFATARAALNTALASLSAARQTREDAVTALRTRLRGLVTELETLLSDDDPRWYQFGLNAPADPETPDTPEAPSATPGAPGSGLLFLDWPDVRRASSYRVWRRRAAEPDFQSIATVSVSEAVLQTQPIGEAIRYRITATNEAGESTPGPETTATLP